MCNSTKSLVNLMAALSYINDYGSSSEDSDCETVTGYKHGDRPKLPAPDLSKVPVLAQDIYEDNPQLHGGRSRSFAHVRGNWTTFVYVNYHHVDIISGLIDKLKQIVTTRVEPCHRCDDFHISLSKTFVLKYHLIAPLSSSLHKILTDVESFNLSFASVKVYCNEENSRTFISLEVDPFIQNYLQGVSKKVDDVLSEFQLPKFYENPSFHMSILWVNGNKKSAIDAIVEDLNKVFFQEIEKSPRTVLIDTINCKSGNKYFQYSLL